MKLIFVENLFPNDLSSRSMLLVLPNTLSFVCCNDTLGNHLLIFELILMQSCGYVSFFKISSSFYLKFKIDCLNFRKFCKDLFVHESHKIRFFQKICQIYKFDDKKFFRVKLCTRNFFFLNFFDKPLNLLEGRKV